MLFVWLSCLNSEWQCIGFTSQLRLWSFRCPCARSPAWAGPTAGRRQPRAGWLQHYWSHISSGRSSGSQIQWRSSHGHPGTLGTEGKPGQLRDIWLCNLHPLMLKQNVKIMRMTVGLNGFVFRFSAVYLPLTKRAKLFVVCTLEIVDFFVKKPLLLLTVQCQC